jgi:WD40 repeat protein
MRKDNVRAFLGKTTARSLTTGGSGAEAPYRWRKPTRHFIIGLGIAASIILFCSPVQAGGPKPRTLSGPKGTVWAVTFAPDGKLVAAVSDVSEKEVKNGMEITNIKGSELRVWETEGGKLKQNIAVSEQQSMAVAFSGDGKFVVTGGFQEAKIWDLGTGETKQSLKNHIGPVSALTFSPDGKILATLSSWFNKGEIRLYDSETWKILRTLKDDTAELHGLVLSADGKTIASANRSNQGGFRSDIKIWDAQTGELKRSMSETQGWVESIALSPDGKTLAAPSQFTIKLWDVQSGKVKRTINEFVSALLFLPDGQTLVGRRADDEIKLFDLKTGKIKRTIKPGQKAWSWAVSRDGKILATGTGDAGKGEVELWDLARGKK